MGCINSKPTEDSALPHFVGNYEQSQPYSSNKKDAQPINTYPDTKEHPVILDRSPTKPQGSLSKEKLVTVHPETFHMFSSFSEFIERIKTQLIGNQSIYGHFLDISYLLAIVEEFSKLYVDHNSASIIVMILIEFMAYCKNSSGGQPQLKTDFTEDYQEKLSIRWQKIRQELYFNNKNHLRMLSWIVKQPGQQKEGFHSLKYDLSLEEARIVASATKKMCAYDLRAICYLTNYLYSSCASIQRQALKTTLQIEQLYISVLAQLSTEHPPAPPIQADQKIFNMHPDLKNVNLIPKIEIDLRKYSSEEEKESALQEFIMERAAEAKQEFVRFNRIIKQICENNDGFHYKSGVKIKDKSQKKAMTRIKEKILGNVYNEIELEQKLKPVQQNPNMSSFINLSSSRAQEQVDFQRRMKSLFGKIKEPLKYKVSDLLRGKCVFTSLKKINKCCSDIRKYIDQGKEDLKLIQIDNRLKKGNSDLVLKILFGNTIAELQLVKDLNTAEYEFSHKLYELQRSKFFTPLTQLAILNEDISKDYFLEVKSIILANCSKNSHNFEEKATYQEVLNSFRQFFQKQQLTFNFYESHPNQIDIIAMKDEQRAFQELLESKTIERKEKEKPYKMFLKNGKYNYEMRNQKKAESDLKSAQRQFEKDNQLLFTKIQGGDKLSHQQTERLNDYLQILSYNGKNYYHMGKYDTALLEYNAEQKFIKQTKGKNCAEYAYTFYKIGMVYSSQGRFKSALDNYMQSLMYYDQASKRQCTEYVELLCGIGYNYNNLENLELSLDYYTKSLESSDRINGKGSVLSAEIYLYIGIIHQKKLNYELALQYFLKALEIKEHAKGKASLEQSTIMHLIGQVYILQGNYPPGLEYQCTALEIQQKVSGKDHINSSDILSNIGVIYEHQGKFDVALTYYNRSLAIKERVLGKQSVQLVAPLSNIGVLYLKIGKHELSLDYLTRALAIQEKIYGIGSINSAVQLKNIGMAYQENGKPDLALQYCLKCLAIEEKQLGKQSVASATTMNCIGMIYKQQGNHKQALSYYSRSLQITQRELGKGRIETVQILLSIGLLHKEQGNEDLALEYLQKCLAIQVKVKGQGSADMASTLMNIGLVYNDKGEYEKGLTYLLRALQCEDKVVGKQNIDLIAIMSHIGVTYNNLQNRDLSLEYFFKALAIHQKKHGKQNKEYAITLNNIASVYQAQGNNESALRYYEQFLQIQYKLNSEGSAQCVDALNSIAKINQQLQNFDAAISSYQKCLEIQQRLIGKDSIQVAYIYLSMGNAYGKLTKYQFAIQNIYKCLQIEEKVKGKDSIDCAGTLANIGDQYYLHEDYQKAAKYFSKSLKIQEKQYGKGDIRIVETLRKLGMAYTNQNMSKQALSCFTRCLQIYERQNGKDCIESAAIFDSIGTVYFRQQQYEVSLLNHNKSIKIQEDKLGKDQVQATYLNNTAVTYIQMKNFEAALQLYKRVLVIEQKKGNKETIDTANIHEQMGHCYFTIDQFSKAIESYKRVVAIYEKNEMKDEIGYIKALTNLGVCYKQISEYKTAISYHEKSLQLCKKLKIEEGIEEGAMKLASCYKANKEMKKAMEIVKTYKLDLANI